jgi:hypothetical protein
MRTKSNLAELTWDALNILACGGQDVEYLTNAGIQGFTKGTTVSEKLEKAKECDVHLGLLLTEFQRRKSSNLVEDTKALKNAVR